MQDNGEQGELRNSMVDYEVENRGIKALSRYKHAVGRPGGVIRVLSEIC